jgi:hypothetical protein
MRWREFIVYYIAAFILLLLFNHTDYLYQASLWKWWTWIDLTARAPHWPWYADWIPHDAWHIVQTIRNHTGIIGAGMVIFYTREVIVTTWAMPGDELSRAFETSSMKMHLSIPGPHWIQELAILLLTYAATRAIAFTLPLELMN